MSMQIWYISSVETETERWRWRVQDQAGLHGVTLKQTKLRKMASLAAKPEDLSSISRTHIVERENRLPKVIHVHTINKYNNKTT